MADLSFHIEKTEGGAFALFETRPRQIGVFPDERHAVLFKGVMEERPLDFGDISAGMLTAAFDAERAASFKVVDEAPIEPDTTPADPVPSHDPDSVEAPEPVAAAPAVEPDWETAFRMLAEGADMKAAAAAIDVRWTQLRGKWAGAKAAYVKGNHHARPEGPAEPNRPPAETNGDAGVSGGAEGVMARGTRKWTDTEELELELAADADVPMAEIAEKLKRTQKDCENRLKWIEQQRAATVAREMAQ